MAHRVKKKKVNNIVKSNFALSKKPKAVQLTIHINNLLLTYPNQREMLIGEFKKCLGGDREVSLNFRVNQIVKHFKVPVLKKWFKDVYGWDFKEEVA